MFAQLVQTETEWPTLFEVQCILEQTALYNVYTLCNYVSLVSAKFREHVERFAVNMYSCCGANATQKEW